MELYELKKTLESYHSKILNIKKKIEYDEKKKNLIDIEKKMNEEDFWNDFQKASSFSKKYKSEKQIITIYDSVLNLYEELIFFLQEFPENISNIDQLFNEFVDKFKKLEIKILLKGKYDNSNCLLEIHPGAGGVESHDFAMMILEMYQKYLQKQKLEYSILEYNKGDVAGIKSAVIEIRSNQAYGILKGESGVHRLIRISPFDSGKRRHTSFASVKITPEIEDNNYVLEESELRIDTFRSSGAGGQSVNTTDSAVRITHIPTGQVVTCQNERSQMQNREQALKILKSKLLVLENEKKLNEQKNEVGLIKSNSFGSQKRTYTLHPYKLVKDHITGFETTQAEKTLSGELDEFIYHNLLFSDK